MSIIFSFFMFLQITISSCGNESVSKFLAKSQNGNYTYVQNFSKLYKELLIELHISKYNNQLLCVLAARIVAALG